MTILQDTLDGLGSNKAIFGAIGKARLDRVIHQPIRLRIMAVLKSVDGTVPIEFTALRELLGVTDGNLGAHLQKLVDANYIEMHKTSVFSGRPLTYISITEIGRKAFQEHSNALVNIII